MAKLFAMEDADLKDSEGSSESEVGDAAQVEAEVSDDVAGETGIEADANNVTEGAVATEELEEAQDVMAASIGEGTGEDGEETTLGDGDGMDEVAVEAMKANMRQICRRLGANPNIFRGVLATENFSSRSSRKANTRIAMEGVGEFLRDLWKKLKAAMNKLMEKVKDFFNKHLSGLGRVKKALESMKIKVNESSGKIKDKAYIDEAPSSLTDTFAGPENEDITPTYVAEYIKNHADVTSKFTTAGTVDKLVMSVTGDANEYAATSAAIMQPVRELYWHNGADKPTPFIGGVTKKIEVEDDVVETTGKPSGDGKDFKLTVEKDTIDNKDSKRSMTITSKDKLKEILTSTLKVINDSIKIRDKAAKFNSDFTKGMQSIEKNFNAPTAGTATQPGPSKAESLSPENVKKQRAHMRAIYKTNSFVNKELVDIFNLNVKLARAVLTYVAFTLKQYKAQA